MLQTLNNPAPVDNDYFGSSVAISGGTIVVGDYYKHMGGSGVGLAYIFDASSGNLLQTLSDPTPAADDYFGQSVAISGDTVIVGAGGQSTGGTSAGAAYVFDASSGNLLQTLNDPDPVPSALFGSAVAVSGDTVVVGAYWYSTGGYGIGAAYVFDAASGQLLQTLNNPSPAAYDEFGRSVAVSGDTILVGTPMDPPYSPVYNPPPESGGDPSSPDAAASYMADVISLPDAGATPLLAAAVDLSTMPHVGAVYVFSAAGGNPVQTLYNVTPAANDQFGRAAAISGNTVVIGSWRDYEGALDAGAAYVYDAASGKLRMTLADPSTSDCCFGSSVAVSGNTIVVGGYMSAYVFDATSGELLDTFNQCSCVAVSGSTVVVGTDGSVNEYDLTTGNLLRTLTDPNANPLDDFGSSVAISGSTIVVGAHDDSSDAIRAGRAYVFDATSGNLLWTLDNPAPAVGDYFGYSVAIAGSTIAVGAFGNDTGATAPARPTSSTPPAASCSGP